MSPVAAAVLPHPPLLVAELAGGAAAELDALRAACRQALAAVAAAADLVVVVGDGPVWGVPDPAAPGSFRPYGADVEVTLPALVGLDLPDLPPPARLAELPLSLAIAAHLLAGLDPAPGRLSAATVPASLGPGAAAAIGRALAAAAQQATTPGPSPAAGAGPLPRPQRWASPGPGAAAGDPVPPARVPAGAGAPGHRVGLVAMGDLSACRTERAPGAFRTEAAGFDASVAEAIRAGEPARLLDLDPAQAADLLVAGRVPLQVLAGAFQYGPGSRAEAPSEDPAGSAEAASAGGPELCGDVLYEDAPYGVGYLVALLTAP